MYQFFKRFWRGVGRVGTGTAISVIGTNKVAYIADILLCALAGRDTINAFPIITQNDDPTIPADIYKEARELPALRLPLKFLFLVIHEF
jgi:hypothetical protein